jgi:AcrR family transcriptional regulator
VQDATVIAPLSGKKRHMKAKSEGKPLSAVPIASASRVPKRRRRSNAVLLKPALPTTNRGRATRERLKLALSALLQRHPFHEIRLEDIAQEAGVRVSLIYHYFRSRTDIMHEVLSDMLEAFRVDIGTRPREEPLDAIRYANRRMVALYVANPGAMRCLMEAHEDLAPISQMWRDLTLSWNRRVAKSISRQFPKAFASSAEYLALAYALGGMVDNFLYEYYVLGNTDLQKAYPTEEGVAEFLTAMWHRALYLENPKMESEKSDRVLHGIGAN